jgi:hypothetical protein
MIYRPDTIDWLLSLRWWVMDLDSASPPALLCDRPFVSIESVDHPRWTVFMPIGQGKIFFGSRAVDLHDRTLKEGGNRIVRMCNVNIISQARRYVFGSASPLFVDRFLRQPD